MDASIFIPVIVIGIVLTGIVMSFLADWGPWRLHSTILRHSPRYRLQIERSFAVMDAFLAVPPGGSSPAQLLWDQSAAEAAPLIPSELARWQRNSPTAPTDPHDRRLAGLAAARNGTLGSFWPLNVAAYRQAALLPDQPVPTASLVNGSIVLQTTVEDAGVIYLLGGAADADPYAGGEFYGAPIPFPSGQTSLRVRARTLLPAQVDGIPSFRWSPLLDVTLNNP